MPAERMPEAFCTNQPGEAKITGPLNTKQRKQVFKRISYKQSDFPLSLTVVVMKLGEHAELKSSKSVPMVSLSSNNPYPLKTLENLSVCFQAEFLQFVPV